MSIKYFNLDIAAAAAAAVCFLYVCFMSYSYAGTAPLQKPEWHDRTDSLHWLV